MHVCVHICQIWVLSERGVQLASIYIPPHTNPVLPPCLTAPHLLVILGNGGVCTPTPSPNHHSVCVRVPVQARSGLRANAAAFLRSPPHPHVPFNLMPGHWLPDAASATVAVLSSRTFFSGYSVWSWGEIKYKVWFSWSGKQNYKKGLTGLTNSGKDF